jgi:hypothetical protein
LICIEYSGTVITAKNEYSIEALGNASIIWEETVKDPMKDFTFGEVSLKIGENFLVRAKRTKAF